MPDSNTIQGLPIPLSIELKTLKALALQDPPDARPTPLTSPPRPYLLFQQLDYVQFPEHSMA